ncbi:MAG: hypothetical protein D6798_19110, partial [Deltaproteobacteria bacterium]
STVPIHDLKISGTFAADGTAIHGGAIQGEVDVRDLTELVGDLLGTKDPDSICGLLSVFGATCETCSSDGATYCLSVQVEDIDGTETTGVEEVKDQDCHPLCAASYSNPDCDTSGW